MSLRECRRFLACYGFDSILEMTSHTPDMAICESSFHGDSSPLNQIFFSQCIQDSDEERSFYSQQKGNIKRSICDKPVIKSSDVYDVSLYEGRARIDDVKSCSEPDVHMSDELNSAVEQENNLHLKQSAVKYKKYTTNKSDSSDSSDDYEVAAKKKKNQESKKTSKKNVKNSKPKNNLHLKQSAVKYKKYTANKNYSSTEREMSASDDWERSFSDECEMPSSDDWEMPPSEESETRSSTSNDYSDSSDESETHSSTSIDYSDSSDFSDHCEVTAKKKKNQKSKKTSKKNVKNSKPKIEKLSEYEKMIQKNRDEKMAFLQSLKMDEVKEDLNEAIKNLKPKRPPKKSSKSVSPSRKSVRLAKVDINLSEEALEERTLAGAKEIKKKLSPILTFEEAIAGNNVYTDFVRDFDDLDFKTPKPFSDYVSCFKNMKIDESKIAKVVNVQMTAMDLHPMKEKVIVSAGNIYGAVGFWHVTSDSVPYVFEPHLLAVSCLKFNADSLNQIISCSDDGTMRCGDMEKRVFNEVFNISEETSCNYFDFISSSTTVVCHRNGNVSLVDIRSHSKSAEKSHKCHESSVKTVSVHPVNKNYFVSADMKGFLSLWDLRKLRKKPVLEVHPQSTVITSAFFSPVTGNSILTSSPADCSLCLFDCSKLGSDLKLYRKVRRNFKGSKPRFKAIWLPNTDDAFVIGSMEYPRRIQVFNNQLDNIYNFQDKYLDSLPITNVFHPSLPVLAGGNSGGKVYIFS